MNRAQSRIAVARKNHARSSHLAAFGLFLLAVATVLLTGLRMAQAADAAAPAVGQPAPAFKLQDQAGKWHSLSDYKGKWVALYFYPKDDTPGCTTQACGFRDNIFAFNKEGAVILGVSLDDVASHKEFAEKHSLPFSLLADTDKAVSRKYGVLGYAGMAAKRETFLIDPQGKVAKHYAAVDPKGNSVEVLADIKALKAKSGAGGNKGSR
jgi:thioredoxin-dependent peroxiredoxin